MPEKNIRRHKMGIMQKYVVFGSDLCKGAGLQVSCIINASRSYSATQVLFTV